MICWRACSSVGSWNTAHRRPSPSPPIYHPSPSLPPASQLPGLYAWIYEQYRILPNETVKAWAVRGGGRHGEGEGGRCRDIWARGSWMGRG